LVYEYLENGDLTNLLFGEFFKLWQIFSHFNDYFFPSFLCLTIFINGRTLKFYYTHFHMQSIEAM
jgi:hypothetical protein